MRYCFIILILLLSSTIVHADIYSDVMQGYIEAPTTAVSYFDTQDISWASEAIESLSSYNIVQGSADGYFYPDRTITRGEYTKIIVSAFGLYDAAAEIVLTDSRPGDWHNTYIAAASRYGISQGLSEGGYGVNEPIKRLEMFVMTYRALKAAKLSLTPAGDPVLFSDDASFPLYAKDAIAYLSSARLLNGYSNGELLVYNDSTRAEACVFIYNVLKASLEGGFS